jgi:hypothetical protein
MCSIAHTAEQPIGLGGAILPEHRHVCAFFNSADEEHRVMLPFIKEGLERGEKAFHIVDPDLRADYMRRFQDDGIAVDPLETSGQLVVRVWEEVHLRNARFDQGAMLGLIEEVLQGAKAEGYPLTRFVAHMEWALTEHPGVNDIVEYEARLNYVTPRYKDPVI